MEALTHQNIHAVNEQLPVQLPLGNGTINYLISLMAPYAEAAAQAESVESLLAWLPQIMPGAFVTESQYWIEKGPDNLRIYGADPLVSARKAIFDFLIDSTLFLATQKAQAVGGSAVLPWDVVNGLVDHLDSRTFFQITDTTLPVEIRTHGKFFHHRVSEELAAGITNYYMGDAPEVWMNGELLKEDSRHTADTTTLPRYRVMVDGIPQIFFTPEYLQGLITAAMWRGEDAHMRVSDVYYIDANGEEVSMTF